MTLQALEDALKDEIYNFYIQLSLLISLQWDALSQYSASVMLSEKVNHIYKRYNCDMRCKITFDEASNSLMLSGCIVDDAGKAIILI